MSNDPGNYVKKMFPEWFVEEATTEEEIEQALSQADGVEFEFDQSPSPEEAEAIIASMIAEGGGQMTMADME